MNLDLTETQSLLQETVRGYLEKELPLDRIRDLERSDGWDEGLWRAVCEQGWIAVGLEQAGRRVGRLTRGGELFEELEDHRMDPQTCATGEQDDAPKALRRGGERMFDGYAAAYGVPNHHVLARHFRFDELRQELRHRGDAVEGRALTPQTTGSVDRNARLAGQLPEQSIVGVMIASRAVKAHECG